MSTHEPPAWLDGMELTDEQAARLEAADKRIGERYPDDDSDDDRREALSAALQVILGSTQLTEVVEQYTRAQLLADAAHAAMTGALIAQVQVTPKIEIHRATRLSRTTIDKAVS